MIVSFALLSYLGFIVHGRRAVWTYVEDSEDLKGDAVEFNDYYLSLARAGSTHILAGFLRADEEQRGHADEKPSVRDQPNLVKRWKQLPAAERCDIAIELHNLGTKLMVVTSSENGVQGYLNYDPQAWADIVCKHALENTYDGVDIHVGDVPLVSEVRTFATNWAVEATKSCRNYINHISHSPKAAYFSSAWGNVYDQLVEQVDTLLVQFYDHGSSSYANYFSTWIKDETWPSWLDLKMKHQASHTKIVVTKWLYPGGGSGGRFTADQLLSGLGQAETILNYTAGVAIWRTPAPGSRHFTTFLDLDLPKLSQGP